MPLAEHVRLMAESSQWMNAKFSEAAGKARTNINCQSCVHRIQSKR
jgi:hypothetical protein